MNFLFSWAFAPAASLGVPAALQPGRSRHTRSWAFSLICDLGVLARAFSPFLHLGRSRHFCSVGVLAISAAWAFSPFLQFGRSRHFSD